MVCFFVWPAREGLPRTWSNPQLSSHIRPGLEPPRLQQAAFDDCVYALDVMRNVAVKQEASSSGKTTDDFEAVDGERKFSLPVRMPNEQQSKSDSNSSQAQQAVAGRLEIRMLHERPNQAGNAAGPTLYCASTPNQNEAESTVFYDAQPADEETFKTARTLVQQTEQETERLETIRDDNDESFKSPAPSRTNVASPQHRKIGTVIPPPIEAKDEEEDDEEEESEEKEKPHQDYQILSEEVDEECRKISVINLNDLSAAFEASSRLSARTPPVEQRRYSQDESSRKKSEEESEMRHEDESGSRRRRQGVEKYISDNSQLNLQFERRRSQRPSSTDVAALREHHHVPMRHRSSLGVGPELSGVYSPLPASAYLEPSTSRLSRPSSAQHSSLNPPSSYEINRVRSSPSIAPSSSGRFPFHYAPHPPTGNPPTLRELDAR